MPANILQYNERMASVVSTMAAGGKKISFHDVKCASPLTYELFLPICI